jgi:hypothetical protein
MEPKQSKSVERVAKVVSATQDLKENVKTRLAEQNADVKEVVVTKMVDEEKKKRVGLLESAFEQLQRLEGEFKKIQPDILTGTDAPGFFSAEVLKKKNDLADKIKKYETALENAITKKDWSSLKELVGNAPKA